MMDALQFCYWLNGYLELSKDKTLDAEQIKSIREHLALVLSKITISQIFTQDPQQPFQYEPHKERVCAPYVYEEPITNLIHKASC